MLAMVRARTVFLIAAAAMLAGCGSTPQKQAEQPARNEPVPDTYRVRLTTSKGDAVIEVVKAWAPNGAERFHRLVETGFYDDCRFFRIVRDFIVQFGINGNPRTEELWRNLTMPDDPVTQSNLRGMVTYAMTGPNSRTTQVFINLKDNPRLDKQGFAPFGKVVEGMEVVDTFYRFYGEGPPRGEGPDQNLIERQGNAYLESKFPRLDYIKRARIEKPR